MLGPRLLLLWCWGALLGAGLDDTSFAHLGPQGLKDSPQPAAGRGWCSTWGSGHFSTFDGHVYDFEGTCNYVFAAICKDASSPTFSVQLRREPGGNISRIIVELGASVVTVQQGAISIKDVGAVSLPYTGNGLQITPFGQSMRLVAKQLELELVVLWGPGAHLTVLVEDKHKGRMCGLCGNFDGEKTNEFLSEDGTHLEPHKYAALQKLDDPNEICVHEAVPGPRVPQAEHARTCAQLLALVAPECDLPKEPFAQSCQADLAACAEPGRQSCACATLSAYSHHCSLAGQPVSRWRRPGLCSLGQCPANQVYQECGEACVKTCSHPQHSCAHSCTFGCFCPEGLVLDDVSKNLTCVPVAQCPCTLSGVAYAPGAVTADACRSCQCTMGRWKCEERPCPQPCALEGGSFVTTFDARPYRFHGTCTYILLQSPQLPDGGTLLAAYDKSGYSHSETSLVTLIYMNSQDKILITQDQVVANEEAKSLPYKMGNITVFRQTSTHLQMATTFGLDLVVQLQPMFQAYITVGPRFRGQTRGLCGNFNGDTTDDFMTSTGIPEGTATLFVDSWRAGNCPAAMQRETDPCSMSQLNKVCAETHCAVLMNKSAIFERCHAVVDPKPFYRRCVYQACNYEETFLHICSALGDYAHTCASKGVLLRGWRSSVDNCTIPCTGNQTYSYDSRACGRTCLSLSDHAAECHPSAVPMEGCNCPEGTYLNHRAECVRKAQCPCLVDNKLILAGQSTVVEGDICYCSNGRLSCPGQQLMLLASCSASKTYQSCSQSSRNKFGAACAPTCQMLATGIPCMPIKCEPGCVCAEGLYENASGQCVPPEECPCEFGGVSYPRGAELNTDCKACICSSGKWTCQQSAHCSSTCTLYGEGHVVTFDGQRFVFEGSCEYILATDGCGTDDSRPTFKILTENVVCGKQGVTCSRAIRMSLGGLSIVLADGNYTVSGTDAQVYFRVKADSLHLIVDVTIGSSYNLTVNWNKHMAVSLKISRASQDPLCGLCGNFNGNMKDDFETRSKYVVSSELEFVNSWKESPLCGDARLPVDPCSLNAFHQAWAERKCSIINSQTFAACHGQVYRQPYYEACVRDTCGCDMSGNCECLCDAVAAYAKACLDKGVCVDWRGPDFCPIYCDFYNSHTRADDGQYQYAQETNCTWHYQPCLCPQQLQSLPYTNMEGCYNCSQDEYFDQDKGTCVQCMLPTTPSPPTTGSPSTEARPTSATPNVTATPGTTGPLSSAAPSSAQTGTAPTTQPEPTVSSGESPRTTSAITTRATSGPAPTATPGSTATGPTVTRATTQPTTSLLSTATQSTARSTVRTTAAWPMPTTPGLATGSPQGHSTPHQPEGTTIGSPGSTSSLSTGHTRPETRSTWATPTGPHTPLTSHSAHTGSVSTTSHITGPPSGTSFRTTTTFPTPSPSNTTQSTQVPSSATSSVTATSHRVVTPTQPHTPFPYISTARPTGSSPSSTHGPATGTVLSPSTPPWATATRGTTQAPHSAGTAKTTNSLLSHPSTPALAGTTSPPRTSMFPKTTGGGTGSPGPHTDTATPNGSHTPLTSHSAPTGSVATTSHITGPPSGTSFRTTTTFPTPSPSITTQSTQVPSSATSSVTATSHRVVTPTQPHTPFPYISTARPTGSSPSSTHGPVTGTVLSPTTPPWATATRGTTQAPHSAGTAKTTTSLLSHPSAPALSGTTSPPRTSMFPKTTGLGTGSPGPHTDTATTNGPQTPFTTHSAPISSVATTSHITGPPSGTSFRTTTTFPTPSPSNTTQSTQVPSSATSSVTATSHRVVTPTQPHTHPPYISTARPTGYSPSSTHGPVTGTVLSPSTPPWATATRGTTQAPHSAGTAKTTTSLLSHPSAPALSGTTFPPRTTFPKTTGGGTGSPGPHTATATPNGPHTPLTSHSAPTGSVATTSHITGPPSGTSFRTTTTFPTPSPSNTTQSTQVPSSATSSVTATSHRVVTPTQPHTPFPYISTARPTGSSPSSTHGPATGTVLSPSTPPWATATRGTTQAPHSDGTAKTTTSLLSHPSTPALAGTTSPPRTSMFPKTTGGGTGSPGPHTDTATPNGPHTPLTSHSAPTGSVATTSHITGPPSGTSFRTTTTFPTPSPSNTTQSTQVPSSATSSVTATSHRVVTSTQPHTPFPYISTTRPTGSSPSSTHDPATGTVLSPSTPPWATATRGTTQAPHSAGTAKTTTSLLSHPSAPALSGTTSPPRTSMFPKTTGLGTGSPGPHTDTATPNGPQTPFTTHSAPTGSVATTSHITGPPSGTSFRTTTTFPTPSPSITTQSTQVPSSATSSVTATSHRVVTPTQPHTHPPYISTARPTGSSPSSTHGPATGTVLSPSTPPWATATRGTTQAPHSAGTAKTTTSLLSHPSAPALSGTTSPPRTSMFPKTTGGGTGSPGPHTATATPNGPHTPLTSHSAPTGSVSTTSHITGPPSGTSFRTTTTFPTPSPSNTTQSTQVPSSATSSVTATSHKVVTSTQPHTPFPYISTTRPTGSSPSSTHDPATGTVLSPSTPPWATATRGTTQAPHSAGTAKTTTSLLSHPSAPALSGTTSPLRTSMFPKTTGLGTGSPGPHTDTATTNGPQTPFTTHSAPISSVATTSHITGPPSGTSFRTTTTFPTPSPSNTTQSTQVPSSATSSVTATSHRVVTPTQPHTLPPYISTARPTGSSPSSTHGPVTGTVLSPSTPPWATATRGTTQAPHSAGTAKTTTSLLSHPSAPALSGTTFPPRTTFPKTTGGGTGSPGPHTATATPNGPHTPLTSHSAPTGSVATTSHITGPPSGTSFRTTTTFPTPSSSNTTQSTQVPSSATSSVTATSHRVVTPTQPHTPFPYISTTRPTGSSPSSTHGPATGTVLSPSTPPWATATRGTTQAPHSDGTAKTTTSLLSHPSTPALAGTTSPPRTSMFPKTTGGGTGSPGPHTDTATPNGPHTPLTSHSAPTGSVATTSHITGPPSGTSFRTTTTFPTPSPSITTQSTQVPSSATSSVTATSHRVVTPTQPHTLPPYISTTMPTGSSPSSTHDPATGTVLSPSTPPWATATRGTTQAPHSAGTAKTTTSLLSHPSAPALSGTTSPPRTSMFPKTTGLGTGSPGPHTDTATPNGPQTPFTTHSAPTGSVATTSHITGPPSGTSFRTSTTFPTPSPSISTQSTQVPSSATSSVTATSHRVVTPTQPHTHPPYISTARPTGSSPSSTHGPATGTVLSPSTPPWATATRGTTQAPHSAGTAKTTTSLLSHPSAPALSGTTSPPRTSMFPKTTGGGTGSPGPHTATATPNGPHTPLTSHSAPTGSVSTTSHITGPPSGTSFRTTTTFPTPSPSNTTQSTQVPSSATSSVTATSHKVVTSTQPHTPFPYISTTRPTGSSPSSTHDPATGTVLSPSTPPWATATRGTTQAPHSAGTAKTTTSLLSHPSAPALSGTTSPPRTSMFPKTTGLGTGSPGPHTDTATTNGPQTPFTSHSAPTGSVATTSHITGPPSGTSFRTTTTFPTPSPSNTTQSTQVPSSATSSVTATSHRVVTPTQPHTHPPYISTARPTGSSPSSTHGPATGTVLSPSTPPWATATRGTTQAPHSAGTAKTTTSLLSHPSAPALSGTTSPPRTSMFPKTTGGGTWSPGTYTATATPNWPHTPFTSHFAPMSSVSTTSQSTSLTTRVPMPSLMSSTLGVTSIRSSPATNLTTKHPGTTGLLTTVFLASSITAHRSSSSPTPWSSTSSLLTSVPGYSSSEPSKPDTPMPTEVCRVREQEEEVTYQGCTANVTVTRCEGVCASSARFNAHTKEVNTLCSCCHPLGYYEKQLVLPCPDPGAPGEQLVLTLQVFKHCICGLWRCRDLGPALLARG